MNRITPLRLFVLALIISFPSLAILPQFSLFLPALIFVLIAGIVGLTRKFVTREASAWRISLYVVLWLACLFVITKMFVPEVDGGGDRDEALDMAVRALLHGDYPYHGRTQLGKPISPLPGTFLLSIPFVLLGDSGYQSFFWLVVLVIALRHWFRDARLALVILLSILISPIIFLDVLFGGDLLANNIYVLVALFWFIRACRRSSVSAPLWPSVFLGIALASRPNFVFWVPLVFSFLVSRERDIIWVTKWLLVAVGVAAALTLPFLLYDPSHFSPLHAFDKVDVIPSLHVGYVIVAVTGLGALGMSRLIRSEAALFRSGAIVQAIPVVLVVVLSIVTQESSVVLIERSIYALNFVLPGIVAVLSD